MIFIEIVLLGISLSMDAFSLALSLGLYYKNISNVKYSITTGIYHFLMPLLGFILKESIFKVININEKVIFILILMIIMLGIIFDNKKETNKMINQYFFGLSVSLDSLLIGITLNGKYILFSCLVFCLVSSIFTLLGFKLSNYINQKFNYYSKYISILILLLIILFNLL